MYDILSSSSTILNPQVTSAFNDFTVSALRLLLLVATGLIAKAVTAWEQNQKNALMKTAATMAVKFAEQRLDNNASKLQYATEALAAKYPRLPAEQIGQLVEEACMDLKTQLGQNGGSHV